MPIPSRYDWNIGDGKEIEFNDIDKSFLFNLYLAKTLNKLNQLFEYDGLPDTIPKRNLELILQRGGHAIIKEVNGQLYAFYSGLGGVPNVYYEPTIAIVANPYLKYNATLEIDKDCVLIRNDSLRLGLLDLLKRYAYLQAETDISIKFAAINSRIGYIINTRDDTEKASAEALLDTIFEGKKLGAIITSDFATDDKLQVYNNTVMPNLIQHLIELKQYNEGTFLQEIGIQSAFNMKREAINEAESTLSTDILFPLVDDMLYCRQKGLEKVNAMYGTNITVSISSVWAHTRTNRYLQEQVLANEADEEIDKDDNEIVDKKEVDGEVTEQNE